MVAPRRAALTAAWLAASLPLTAAQAVESPPLLQFRIDEGRNINSFLRQGPVAAHLLLRSGIAPRLLVAFPAGNSGVGLWFAHSDAPVSWTLRAPPRSVSLADAKQRPLHGIEFEVDAEVAELKFAGAVLSSVRVLRDYELQGKAPMEVRVAPRITGATVSWARDRLDGGAGYRLDIDALDGARVLEDRLRAPAGVLRLRVRALTGEPPLTALPVLLDEHADEDARTRDVLAFLGYREKFLAGSWRFDTYFGRDTLISALLLAPVLEPLAVESALTSVLERLAPDGEVAHEEDIGEFAVLRNLREGRGRSDAPIYDYGMVDDDFLLAPLASRWLLDDARGRARATAFLAQKMRSGEAVGERLARNLAWVTTRTAGFAHDPVVPHLVGIKEGRATGNWRDSESGLGGGRYPYDVNAALVPAALAATGRLHGSGLLEPYLDAGRRRILGSAAAAAAQWNAHAPPLFRVTIDAARARADIARHAREIGVDAAPALAALGDSPSIYHALSLDAAGRPIPILHSDEGFRWLLGEPSAAELTEGLTAIMRPFPAGLFTDAGMLVANPAHATPALRREFSRNAYHGTVVWSWQQALMAAALERQQRRTDLPETLRAKLIAARRELWNLIEDTRALRTSELWSWSFADGRFRAEPFGRAGPEGERADADESNAAQLWSTVFLGLEPPARVR